jgi:hypothetical protein
MVAIMLAPSTAVAPGSEAEMLRIGLTFSPREAIYRDLSWRQTFHAALEAAPALLRIGAYWNEIEPLPGAYDFSTLDWLLDQASARGQQVLLTVGMKAPRWPEYYLPRWLASQLQVADEAQVSDDPQLRVATRALLTATVEHVRERSVVVAWQVENEPLDPAGPHRWRIGADYLAEEVALVRALDPQHRPIIVNTFIETQPLAALPGARAGLWARTQQALALADVLGLDVYPSRTLRLAGAELTVTWPAFLWAGVLADLHQAAAAHGKDAWIVEAQAEPWRSGGRVPPPAWPGASVGPWSVAPVLSEFAAAGFRTVLLWGVEHWEARRSQDQDASWWTAVTRLLGEEPGADRLILGLS